MWLVVIVKANTTSFVALVVVVLGDDGDSSGDECGGGEGL